MIWKTEAPIAINQIEKLSAELNHLDFCLTTLLLQKKIDTYEKAKDFFRPNLAALHDPFLMKDMDIAVNRLQKAVKNKEKILVFGDYDVDGTTAVALVWSYLQEHAANVDFYIPDRYKEGYGISIQGIDFAAQHNISLIIALDCGIKAHDKINYAKSKNIDFIICDHHLPSETLPEAFAILDPKRKDCIYPFKELSGCGVGFKLMQALCIENKWEIQKLYHYLDLVAISIAADIVPIVGENRILTAEGLKLIQNKNRKSIATLLEFGKIQAPFNIHHLVFGIAPRINAAGRIETGKLAVEMLLSEEENLVINCCEKINELNSIRKQLDQEITQEALNLLAQEEDFEQKKSTVVFQPHWHKGVVGIVASRLIETHYRPTIVLTQSEGKLVGSARSVFNFDLYQAISNCSHLLEQYGGHYHAAGLTLKPENLDAFKIAFEQNVRENIQSESLLPFITINAEINLDQITNKWYQLLEQFGPFGPGNMQPVFVTKNVIIKSKNKLKEKYLKLEIYQEKTPNTVFSILLFDPKHINFEAKIGQKINIAYSIEKEYFQKKSNLQLKIKSIVYL